MNHLSPSVYTLGAENAAQSQKNGSVQRDSRLRQTDPAPGRRRGLLQGLRPQHAEHRPLCWYWPGCVWGQRETRSSQCGAFPLALHFPLILVFHRRSNLHGWTGTRACLTRGWWCCWDAAQSPVHAGRLRVTRWRWSAHACKHKVRTGAGSWIPPNFSENEI